jgi:hypothetical protein
MLVEEYRFRGAVMRRLLMVGVLAVGSAGSAHAADPPSVMGTWTGEGHSISGEGWETERSYTLVVTEQRGPVFKGRNEWPGGQEDVVGVIRADGKSIHLSNSDGVSSAMLLGPDSMEACYAEGGDDAQAVCMTLTRAK